MQRAMTTRNSGRRLAGWTAGLMGLALIAGSLTANPGDGLTPNGPGGGIGTLPSTASEDNGGLPLGPYEQFGGPTQVNQVTAPATATRPALTLRGLEAELDAWILRAYSPDGSGWFELSALAADGTRTITYHGNVTIQLDRAIMHAGSVSAALTVDPAAGGQLAVVRAGNRSATQALTVGEVSLPLQRATRAGLLADGLELTALARGGARTARLDIAARGRTILIEQVH